MGRLLAALLALYQVTWVVAGVDLLAADLGGRGQLLLDLTPRLDLRGVSLHLIPLLELLRQNVFPLRLLVERDGP